MDGWKCQLNVNNIHTLGRPKEGQILYYKKWKYTIIYWQLIGQNIRSYNSSSVPSIVPVWVSRKWWETSHTCPPPQHTGPCLTLSYLFQTINRVYHSFRLSLFRLLAAVSWDHYLRSRSIDANVLSELGFHFVGTTALLLLCGLPVTLMEYLCRATTLFWCVCVLFFGACYWFRQIL